MKRMALVSSSFRRPINLVWFAAGIAGVLLLAAGCASSTGESLVVPTYIDIRPAWSPDGRTIAFTRVEDTVGIYLVDTTGANLRLLRAGEGIGVTWSPDSRWIAFSSNDSLIAMMVDRDSVVALTDGSGNIRPSWSPDGLRIAFIKKDNNLWLLNVASKTTIDLNRALTDYPSWNPLTSELIYMQPDFYTSSQGIVYEFKALNIPTDTARTLYSVLTNYVLGFCSINSKGDHLLYSVAGGGDYVQLFTADLVLKTGGPVTDDGADFGAWSPDGSEVVYTRTQQGDGGLWIMYADGSGRRRLTTP